jgi:hypothetical protein
MLPGDLAQVHGNKILKKLKIEICDPENICSHLNQYLTDLALISNQSHELIVKNVLDLIEQLNVSPGFSKAGIFGVYLNLIIILEYLLSSREIQSRKVAYSALFEIEQNLYWRRFPSSAIRKTWIKVEKILRVAIDG